YEIALKNALRQDPDIVVVGEIRDIESLDAVLKLAETGHLVLTTLHTNSAVESINRIVSMVLAEKKDFIRQQLASVLRFIFSQELYIDKEKQKRNAIFEILNNTKAVSNLILNNKINQIPNLIESGIDNYMITKEKYFSMIEK
ncbi:ATPase, T2SS/T4P/T4SS family, partial [Fusobacterium sp.]|uniref:ATPase, T2SS/T4P/T4SS family n=1 Tax=Fusobacterium sp. TaxID=68766 RepID=UPI0025B7D190